MKIGITLNEVFRDYIGQLTYVYNKYIAPCDIKEGDVDSFDLLKFYKFSNKAEFNKFCYDEAAMEIYAHADQLHDNVMNQFNMFLMDIQDDGEHQIQLVSREVYRSIPSTLFFLSKLGCRATDIRFVKEAEQKWEGIDVLITANPQALECKPQGKISVKVNASYNKDVKADYTIDSILEFMKDEALREKILNSKITTYEEIKD